MQWHKFTFTGPQTSMTVAGIHFRRSKPVYLMDEEMPLPMQTMLGPLGLKHEAVEADERPVSITENLEDAVDGSVGLVWEGMSPRKSTDYGTFHRGVPRFDVSAEAVRTIGSKSGWRRVER